MLGIFGGENWTPNTNHPGLFKRAGHRPVGDLLVGPEGEGRLQGQLQGDGDRELRQDPLWLAPRGS